MSDGWEEENSIDGSPMSDAHMWMKFDLCKAFVCIDSSHPSDFHTGSFSRHMRATLTALTSNRITLIAIMIFQEEVIISFAAITYNIFASRGEYIILP